MPSKRPLVAVSTCRQRIAPHDYNTVGEKYIAAVHELAECVPLALPTLGNALDISDLLGHLDGLLLTGSYSNVELHHYGGPPSAPGTLHDPPRDETTLPLIRAAVAIGIPVLGICRGCQEMNVAFGGSLYQRVHERAGMLDHREPEGQPVEVQYGPAHPVRFSEGGLLRRITRRKEAIVNSVHWQGVAQLGEGLSVEALAPDGLVEAFRVTDSAALALGVQWHPEWKAAENAVSRALFQAFGRACRERAGRRYGC